MIALSLPPLLFQKSVAYQSARQHIQTIFVKIYPCEISGLRRVSTSMCRYFIGGVAAFSLVGSLTASAEGLSKLIDEVTASHPQVRVQRSGSQSAQADVDTAKWQYFPTLSLSVEQVEAESDDLNYQGDDRVATLRLQQPLFTGGRLTKGYDKAQAVHRSKVAAVEEARQGLALQAVQSYGDWLTAHLKGNASKESLQEHQRLYDQIAQRVKKGKSAENNQVLASSRLQQARAEMSIAKIQSSSALARLSQLLGRNIDERELVGDLSNPLPVQETADTLIEQAKARSPELVRLEAAQQAQQAEIGVNESSLWPELYLRLELQDGDFSNRNVGTDGRVFLGLKTNFGAGLSALSRVSGARARYVATQAEVEASHRNLMEQIITDSSGYEGLKELSSALQISLTDAKEVHASYIRQYKSGGLKTWLDVMNAAREVARTEMQLADAQGSMLTSSWRLAILTRGLGDLLR